MKWLWRTLGRIIFWLSWPVLWLYLRSGTRTRVLIICRGEILVVKGWLSDGRWSLPGGGLHRHETAPLGAAREVYEETSIRLRPGQLRELSREHLWENGLSFDCIYFAAEVPAHAKLRRQRWEIVEVRWLAQRQLTLSTAGTDIRHALAAWRAERRI